MAEFSVDADLQRNYDGYYEGRSEWRRLGAIDKASNIVAACRSIPHARVIDIGAGEGSVVAELHRRSFADEYFALEISSSGVDAINARAIPALKEARAFDGYAVPYADGEFDLAVLSHVVEHVEHPRRLLTEAGRVADHLFVEVPLEDTMRSSVDYRESSVGHINFYSYRTIRKLLQSTGFEVLSQTVTNPSRAVHVYRSGRRGAMTHLVREVALRTSRRMSGAVFVYHCHLLARRAARSR